MKKATTFQIHVCTLSLYDETMDCILWQQRYVVLDGNDNRLLRYVDGQIPDLMAEYDYEYSCNDLRLTWACEEEKQKVPKLVNGDTLLLSYPEQEELNLQDGILETLQQRIDWVDSQKLLYLTSKLDGTAVEMKDRSQKVQQRYTELLAQLRETYQERYGSIDPLLAKPI